jgi:multiple antibiotic resistance protein
MNEFGLAFVFMLVAVDPFGLLPIFVSLTEGMTPVEKRRVVEQGMVTALCVAIGFLFVGRALFRAVGVTVSDFMIAGGTLLFVIAVKDLMTGEKRQRVPGESLGAVPLGTPLIVGPAVLASTLILRDVYGLLPTISSIVANILLVGIVFLLSGFLVRLLGRAGTKALSKVFLVFLAAFAVMMIRRGILEMIAGAA